MEQPPPAVDLRRLAVGRVGDEWGERSVPEEVAISLTYNRDSYAVMMATPLDLEDFGVGFSLNEGLISRVGELTEIELCRHELGLELRMSLGGEASERSLERRRRIAGPVGCGLCGENAHAATLCPSFYRAEVVQNPRWHERLWADLRGALVRALQPA